MQIAYNKSNRTEKILYIVVHDTGNRNKGADAKAHFNYFNSGDRQSSADFFVDENGALKVNDYEKFYTWHCGDGKGKYGITNKNSIGVELCVNQDGDYNKTIKNAIECVKELMIKLNIPVERVVRHYDASKKLCPASLSQNDWQMWKNFKEELIVSDELTVKMSAGLSDETIEYLKKYTYGQDLIRKLAEAIKKRA